jgi:membrane protease YdiL (CAAX protease family)
MHATRPNFWQDALFYAALAGALLVWLGMYLLFQPESVSGWPLREPLRFLYPALLYPVVEELVFRGLLQDLAHRYLKPWRVGALSHANILVSLAFTGMHFINHPPAWAVSVFVPSLIFGLFKDRTGGLIAPILLHVFYNSGYLWIFTQ